MLCGYSRGLHATPVSHLTWKHCIGCQFRVKFKTLLLTYKTLNAGTLICLQESLHIYKRSLDQWGCQTHTLKCLQHLIFIPEYIHPNHNWLKVYCISHLNCGTHCHWRLEWPHQLSVSKNGWELCFLKVLALPDMLYDLNPMSLFSWWWITFLLLGWSLDDCLWFSVL